MTMEYSYTGIVGLGSLINNVQFYYIEVTKDEVENGSAEGVHITCFKEPGTMFSAENVVPLKLSSHIGHEVKIGFKMRAGNTIYGCRIIPQLMEN